MIYIPQYHYILYFSATRSISRAFAGEYTTLFAFNILVDDMGLLSLAGRRSIRY